MARHLLKRLNANGGTRVEIHLLNQSGVARPLRRDVPFRQMNVRRWDRIVGARAAGDHHGLDAPRTDDVLSDQGFQYGANDYCTNAGLAA